MKSPVLFIVFNRLSTAQQVFNSIREYQPNKIYIAADGPRMEKEGEKEKCNDVREWVLSHIDWECDVKTLFQSENLGCGKGPASAITWFFDYENEGIILEDDCMPHKDFFVFCEQLLAYYRNDHRISIISGCNFDLNKEFCTTDSYYYSVFPYTWGWATWKRNWNEYDYNLTHWKKMKQMDLLTYIFKDKKYNLSWKNLFDKLSNDEAKDIWDYQFFFQCFRRKQLSIVPSVNLISNIGCGKMATHTTLEDSAMSNLKLETMTFSLNHPLELRRNITYDVFLQELNYGVIEQVSFFKKIKRFIKKQMKFY
jgi:hypothetical protein